MQLDDLFISATDEMRTIYETFRPWHYDAEYKLLRLSGLLRQMLTDDTKLVHQINRRPEFHWKITFELNKNRNLTSSGFLSWLDPYNTPLGPAASPAPEMIELLSLDQFLATPILQIDGRVGSASTQYTVLDLINYYANIDGAVHRSETLHSSDSHFQPLRDAEADGQRFDGCPFGMSVLRIITGIAVRTLSKWESTIRTQRMAAWDQMQKDLADKGHL